VVRVVAVVSQQRERTQEKLAQQMSIQTEELRAVLSPPPLHQAGPACPFPRPLFVCARAGRARLDAQDCRPKRPRALCAHGRPWLNA